MSPTWEPTERLWQDGLGAWHLVQRARGYREAHDRALMWRAKPALPELAADSFSWLEMLFHESLWLVDRIDDPIFARVLEHGVLPQPYVVVEGIEAVPARALLDAGRPLPPALALGIAGALLEALDGLAGLTGADDQALGLVHLRFGPDQLWLTPEGLRLPHPAVHRMKLTADHTMAHDRPADLDAIPPEVIRGRPADAEADVFAAAVSVLGLLIGRSPFLRRATMPTLAALSAGERGLSRETFEGIPPALAAGLRHALDADPAKRPPSARALLQRLEEARRADGLPPPRLEGLGRALEGIAPSWRGLPTSPSHEPPEDPPA